MRSSCKQSTYCNVFSGKLIKWHNLCHLAAERWLGTLLPSVENYTSAGPEIQIVGNIV